MNPKKKVLGIVEIRVNGERYEVEERSAVGLRWKKKVVMQLMGPDRRCLARKSGSVEQTAAGDRSQGDETEREKG